MPVYCPECDAAVQVPEPRIAAGVPKIRCPNCGCKFEIMPGGAPATLSNSISGGTLQPGVGSQPPSSDAAFGSDSDTPASPTPGGAGSDLPHLTGAVGHDQQAAILAAAQGDQLMDYPKLPVGTVFRQKYRIDAEIGHGASAVVYRARDVDADIDVALKVVGVVGGQADGIRRAWAEEYKARRQVPDGSHLLGLESPQVQVIDGTTYVALPQELGQSTLRDWLKENKHAIAEHREEALSLFGQICRGVEALHKQNLAHLDLKPENIILVKKGKKELVAKVGDFGLARAAGSLSRREGTGTPAYMAPEQVRSAREKDIGPWSDIYALGCILFELLDGDAPFSGSSEELKDKHLNFPPPELEAVPEHHSKLVTACLEKQKKDRPNSIESLLVSLDDPLVNGDSIGDQDSVSASTTLDGYQIAIEDPELKEFLIFSRQRKIALESGKQVHIYDFDLNRIASLGECQLLSANDHSGHILKKAADVVGLFDVQSCHEIMAMHDLELFFYPRPKMFVHENQNEICVIDDSQISIWRIGEIKPTAAMSNSTLEVMGFAAPIAANRVAVAFGGSFSETQSISIIDPFNRFSQEKINIDSENAELKGIEASDDGKWMVAKIDSDDECLFRAWQMPEKRQVGTLKVYRRKGVSIGDLNLHPTQPLASFVNGSDLRLWDFRDHSDSLVQSGEMVRHCEFVTQRPWLLFVTSDWVLVAYDYNLKQEVGRIRHRSNIKELKVDRDSEAFWVLTENGVLRRGQFDIFEKYDWQHDGCPYCSNTPVASELDPDCPVCGGFSYGAEQAIACPLCRGDGFGTCNSCSGSGVCESCNGSGKWLCDECEGAGCKECKNTGFKLCWDCEGNGCEECEQTGYKSCLICDGSAKCEECYDGKSSLKCIACNGLGRGNPTALVLSTIKTWVGGGIIEHAVADLKGVLSGVPADKALELGDLVLDMLKRDGFPDRSASEIRATVNKRLNEQK